MSAFDSFLSGNKNKQKWWTHREGASQSLHSANLNWTLKYGERHKLIFYDLPEQIKAQTHT